MGASVFIFLSLRIIFEDGNDDAVVFTVKRKPFSTDGFGGGGGGGGGGGVILPTLVEDNNIGCGDSCIY
jgi:hypothetical protein